jgi:hypothetical protein
MSQIRLYLDEDAMRKSLVFALRVRSVDVLSSRGGNDQPFRSGSSGDGDRLETGFVLHQIWMDGRRSHAGIIVAPQQRYTAGEELRRLMHILGSVSAEDMQDRLEFLSAWE